MSASISDTQGHRLWKAIMRTGKNVFQERLKKSCLKFQKTGDAARKLIKKIGLCEKMRHGDAFTLNSSNCLCVADAFEMSERTWAREFGLHLTHVPREEQGPTGRLRTLSRDRLLAVYQESPDINGQIQDTDFDALPDEIHLAIGSLHGLAESAAALRVSMEPNNRQLVYLTCTESSHKGLEDPQKHIQTVCQKLWKQTEPIPSDDFGATVGPDTGLFLQEIFVFPFTMSRARRSHFGVLPYATQTDIVFVLHKNHPACREFSDNKRSLPPLEPVPRSRLERLEFCPLEWMADMVKATRMNGGKIFSVAGDVQFSIFMDALHRSGSHVKAITDLADIQAKQTRHGNTLDKFFSGSEVGKHGVFIVDPWESDRLGKLGKDYRAIICPHGVDVKVGVGFSLNMIPNLIEAGAWRKVWAAAYAAYRDYSSELKRIGVRMLTADELRAMRMPPPPDNQGR